MDDYIVTSTAIPSGHSEVYYRELLDLVLEERVHDRFAQVKPLKSKQSQTIKFRRYGTLASKADSPLIEGVTPSGSQLSKTDITAIVQQYGDYTTITDVVIATQPDPSIMDAMEILSEQLKDTWEEVVRNVLVAGTNVQYVGSGNIQRSDIAAADVMTSAAIHLAALALRKQKAKTITKMVRPDEGYDTTPVKPCYVAFAHPDVVYDLENESNGDFVPVEKYANKADVMPGEIGKVGRVRIIETLFAKVWDAAGTSSADVYATVIVGRDAYGVVKLDQNAIQVFIDLAGGNNDPLHQRNTTGWKLWGTAVRLNELHMIRLESSSSQSA